MIRSLFSFGILPMVRRKTRKKKEEPVNTKDVVLLLMEWRVGVDRSGRRGHSVPRSQVSQTKVP